MRFGYMCVVFVLCSVFLLGAFPLPLAAAEKHFVALGDSVAAGYRLDGGKRSPRVKYCDADYGYSTDLYVNRIADTLGLSVYNYAVSGDTTADLVKVLETADAGRKEIIRDAEFFVISIGGNDLLHSIGGDLAAAVLRSGITGQLEVNDNFRAVLDSAFANYQRILGLLCEMAPGVPIYAQTVHNPFAVCLYGADLGEVFDPYIGLLNEKIRSAAAECPPVTLIGMAELNRHKESFYTDVDVHLTPAGNTLLADMYLRVIDPGDSTSLTPEKETAGTTAEEATAAEPTGKETTTEETTAEETTAKETTTGKTADEEISAEKTDAGEAAASDPAADTGADAEAADTAADQAASGADETSGDGLKKRIIIIAAAAVLITAGLLLLGRRVKKK